MPSQLEILLSQLGALPPPAQSANIPLIPYQQPNVPEYTPSQVVEPPQAPFDNRFITQFAGLAGAPPTPPPAPSTAQRIFNAIGGFGAGVQGYGPQYLAQLQEPQREYQRQLNDYNANKQRLGVLGLETGLRSQEARTRRAQEVSDQQFEREARDEARKLNISDQYAFERFKDSLQRQRDVERERAAAEKQAKLHERELIDKDFYPPPIAKEIAQYTAGLQPNLSAAAVNYQGQRARKLEMQSQKLQADIAKLNRVGAGRGVTVQAQRAVQNFEAAKQAVNAAVASGDVRSEKLMRRKLDAAYGQLAKFPGQIEAGYGTGGYPYAKLVGPSGGVGLVPQAAQPQGKTKTIAEIRALAAQAGIGEQEAIQRAQAAGWTITQ